MADLDDFFAKKDKKKNKSKKAPGAEVPVAKKQETISAVVKEETSLKKEEEQPKQPPATEEEEWKDFEEEKKDYTGLKLGQLTITDDDKNQQNLGGDSDNEGQYYLDSGSSDNPWKKSDPSAPQEAPKQPKAPAPTGGYVAPHLRGPKKAKKGIAPDLNNQDFFPSLGTEKAPELKSKKDDFEEVKHGGRIKSDANVTIPVSLGNRFTSLSNDTS